MHDASLLYTFLPPPQRSARGPASPSSEAGGALLTAALQPQQSSGGSPALAPALKRSTGKAVWAAVVMALART